MQNVDSGIHVDIEVGMSQEPRKMSVVEEELISTLIMRICDLFALPDSSFDFLHDQVERLQSDCCFSCAVETLRRMALHDDEVTEDEIFGIFWRCASDVTTEAHLYEPYEGAL